MIYHHDLRSVLKEEFEKRRAVNYRFSLRRFAQVLKMSPATLSQILSGKRKITAPTIRNVAKQLGFSKGKTHQLLRALVERDAALQSVTSDEDYEVLADDQFALISGWHHFAILSLGETPDNRANPALIARKLGISIRNATGAIKRLERMGLIKIFEDGSFRQTSKPLTLRPDIPRKANRQFFRQSLKLALDKLETVSVDEREYRAVTMAIDPELLPAAKEMIKLFMRELCLELESRKKKDVYTLAVQLYPLTQRRSKSIKEVHAR